MCNRTSGNLDVMKVHKTFRDSGSRLRVAPYGQNSSPRRPKRITLDYTRDYPLL
jgi:hypothetical protein